MPPGEDAGQERTLPPTQKKIDEAKERGEFPRSREATTVALLLALLLLFWLSQSYLLDQILHVGVFFLRFDSLMDLSVSTVAELLFKALLMALPILLPVLITVFFAGLAAELGQIGIRFRKDPFEPKWEKLNPVAGLKRMFSLKQLVEGIKSALKLFIFVYVAYRTIRGAFPLFATMNQMAPMQAVEAMLGVGLKLGFWTCALLVLFAGFDYWFQRWQYFKQLRMTPQEAKDEIKQQEGDPVLKARIRSIQMDLARKRMMTAVPDSDVVVTNPMHYAVALRFDPEECPSPIVVAKGQNYLAQRIREVAESAGVPMVENPPMARMLHKQVAVGQAIPGHLFKAVAEILASVWFLSEKRGRGWARPAAKQIARS